MILSLFGAIPEGPEEKVPDFWNKALYWTEESGTVKNFVSCGHGVLKAGFVNRCSQSFYMQELNADVSIDYTQKHLRDWKEIQRKVATLIEGFYEDGRSTEASRTE